jgi:integrase
LAAGLRWEDYYGGALWVSRSKWNNFMLEPKTKMSAAPVPVIFTLVERLTLYREYLGNPVRGPMFPGPRNGKPIDLNNVLNRIIKPALASAGLRWSGFHAFRRGLATYMTWA